MSVQDDYAFYVYHVKRMFWVPVLIGACNAPFQPWTIPVHAAAALVCFIAARIMSAGSFSLLRFLAAANAAIVAVMLTFSVMLTTLAPEQIRLALRPHVHVIAVAFGVFSFLWFLVFTRIWTSRWIQFEQHARKNRLAADAALSLMTGRGGMSFWRTGAGPGLMALAATTSAWVGYRLGMDAKFVIAAAAFTVIWPVMLGTVIAQYFTIRKRPQVASIMLYR